MTLHVLAEYITNGWPSKDAIPVKVQAIYPASTDLSVTDGIITKGSQIVIPESMQKEVLQKLHESHQGISKCRECAHDAVWWPGISKYINNLTTSYTTTKREPLRPTPLPDRPWETLGTDLFEIKGKHYLVVVYYYSRWLEIRNLTSSHVIKELKDSVHGTPDTVQSDNGPQFSSQEFSRFSSVYGFVHTTSSPYLRQAN